LARVLVIDDDEDVRSFVADTLRLARHAVAEASTGSAGLAAARASAFHVVVTDLRMPGIDGLEVLRTLKAEQPETEVVLLTAHGTVANAVEAMKEGAFDYLQKPIGSPSELRLVVERALERRVLRDRQAATADDGVPPLTFGAPAMGPVVDALRRVARTDATVLLTGESGTGKEVAARAVHGWSRRASGPFVAVNCAALPDHLVESELFGHEKGAFTGADARRRGRIELAEGGTFLLDEVAELEPAVQAKLLRVLQERAYERVGGTVTLPADVRLIAATNRDLQVEIREGRFREDLYHRLAVFPVHLPPLRDRPQDVPGLAEALLKRIAASLGRPSLRLAPGAGTALAKAAWPGNVRGLANALERAAILARADVLRAEDVLAGAPGPTSAAPGEGTLDALERAAIEAALARYGGHRKKAADHLGIGERTLYDKLRRYGLG
jgi:two-component system response regulator FlrC